MRRSRIAAVAAAIIALSVFAPAAQAMVVAGTLDQSAPPGDQFFLTDSAKTQTFTAGLTGQLTLVQIYCAGDTDSNSSMLTISIGTHIAVGVCGPSAGWTSFDFTFPVPEPVAQPAFAVEPPTVTAGQQYTIAIASAAPHRLGIAAADYAGGAAAEQGYPIEGVTDLAFRTYVLVSPQASLPPTSTVHGPASSDGAPTFLLLAGLAGAAGLLIAGRRYQGARTR